MAVQAELCELTLRQVFERTSHSSGRYPVETNFRLWPARLSAHRQLLGIGPQRQLFDRKLVVISA